MPNQHPAPVICNAKPTSCPNDPVPSKLVKQYTEVFLPTIARMVNASLYLTFLTPRLLHFRFPLTSCGTWRNKKSLV